MTFMLLNVAIVNENLKHTILVKLSVGNLKDSKYIIMYVFSGYCLQAVFYIEAAIQIEINIITKHIKSMVYLGMGLDGL